MRQATIGEFFKARFVAAHTDCTQHELLLRLLLLADITCDVNGSIECLERTTAIEDPFFNYDPYAGMEVSSGIGTSGITVLGVDILPSELPRESSAHFGKAVSHVLQDIRIAKERTVSPEKGVDVSLLPSGLVCS